MDRIGVLLRETGWNCDELIQKIEEYKLTLKSVDSKEQINCSVEINSRSEIVSENCTESSINHHVSFEEVENDHSYTCRTVQNVGYNLNKNINEDRQFYRRLVKEFDWRTKQIYRRRFLFLRKLKHRYRLQKKYAAKDRKMLICKYKSKEGVRSEIMHQLELLRSKRTLGMNSNVKQTIVGDTIFLKKRYSGEKAKENETLEKEKIMVEDYNDSYDLLLHPELEEEEQSIENKDLCSIKPTKTNDITKIKGWKNKKFIAIDQNKVLNGASPTISNPTNDESTSENKMVSAFASTNLDGFLHDSANLHISFEIPTLDSGNNDSQVNTSKEDLQTKPDNVQTPPPQMNNDEELLMVAKVDPLNLYRPRTLGQKRRIWKLRTDTNSKKKMEDVTKPRTLAEKRRMMDNDVDVRNRLKAVDRSDDVGYKYSYVQHRGRRLKIPTRTENGIIAYIKSHYGKRDYIYVPRKVKPNKMKPSIFATTPIIQPQVMRYRPGPLSKKVLLQEYNKDWKTEIRTLPKVYLRVTPQAHKPISPRIRHLLPQYGFELTEERISFALSTLRTQIPDSFIFPVPYANKQEYMLLRRKIQMGDDNLLEPVKAEDNNSIEETVQNVIDKMLDYVEIKTISDEVVMDDVTEKIMREEKANGNDQQNITSKKKKTKQSKTNYELKRLNVKVIEVNLEDKGESGDCNKEFCRLGCVCKSLSTTSSLVSNHCGVPDCMFKCNCNYEKKSKGNLKVTLPIGTDLLSEGAVNRLEVEAKKNLAKVEKEFTQTVIQANNQTIVVGGCTNRQRRVTKLPKKYTDFIEDPDGIGDVEQVIEDEIEQFKKVDKKLSDWKPVPCTVYVTKLNLDQVVPYCMVHHLYDCYCEYKATFERKGEGENKNEDTIRNDDRLLKSDEAKDESSSDVRVFEACARTKGLPTNYYLIRNKSEKFLTTRKRKLEKLYRNYMDKEEKCKRATETEEDITVHVTEEPQTSTTNTNTASNSNNEPSKEKRTRRKQNLLIRRDSSPIIQNKLLTSENALQRRKKHKKYINKSLDNSNPLPDTTEKEKKKSAKSDDYMKTRDLQERIAKFEQIFQTASTPSASNLYTPSSLIQEKLSEILGRSIGSDVQYRLIPWDVLIKKYESNSLKLWYSTYFKKPRIIATDNRTIPKHFVNVRNYENVPNKEMIKADVVRWLVTRTVPICNSRENIFIIVQLTKTHCELCGLWEKKQNNQADKMVLISQPSDKTNAENKMYSIVKKIMFSKCKFSKQTLLQGTVSNDSHTIPAISAYLPQISNNSKWRMIKLNSDFSVLSLHRNKYAIKYSDLQKVMKMAKETSFTIVLKTAEVEMNYPHPDFGMYASPDCDDSIFIGPYFHSEDHDITTLRYVNRELIRTDVFCKMKGQKPPCNGFWLYQLAATASTPAGNSQTIDLTEYESDSESKKVARESERELEQINIQKSTPDTVLKQKTGEINIQKSTPDTVLKQKTGEINIQKSTPDTVLKQKTGEINIQKSTSDSVLKQKSPAIISLGRRNLHYGELITQSDLLNYESCATDYTVPENFYEFLPMEIDINAHKFEPQVYFVTNVSNMGFITGYKLSNSIIIQWPSIKYIVKFPGVSHAVGFLQRELNTYFITNPSFQITIKAISEVDFSKMSVFNLGLLKGYYVACPTGVTLLLNITKPVLKEVSLTMTELDALAKQRAQRMIFDKCYELVRILFSSSRFDEPNTTYDLLKMINKEVRRQEIVRLRLANYQSRLLEQRQNLRLKCTSVIKELQPLVSPKMQNAMMKILNFNKILTEEKSDKPSTSASNSNEVICIDADSEEEVAQETSEISRKPTALPTPPTPPPPAPAVPKITVKKIQDLKEPANSPNTNSKVVSLKSFSILKNKSPGSEISATATSDNQKTPVSSENSSNAVARPISDASSSNCKTFTIKRSILNKKCSKFVIKTTNGKYMTIRAEDLKELPVKKLQPIAPNDPVISKLSGMSTKRILMPAKGNGFLKVNFSENSGVTDTTIKSVVENGQQSKQTSSSSKQI